MAFRDPNGIRPLVVGQRTGKSGRCEYMVASESVALDVLAMSCSVMSCRARRYASRRMANFTGNSVPTHPSSRPVFSSTYFAARFTHGQYLGVQTSHEAGCCVGEEDRQGTSSARHRRCDPHTRYQSRSGAVLAYELGVKFREGFMKNRYIGRTFIMPGQSERKSRSDRN